MVGNIIDTNTDIAAKEISPGIPVSKMLESEREKLLKLEDELHERVVGQDEAIQAVERVRLPDSGHSRICR